MDLKSCKCCNQEFPATLEYFPKYKDRLYSYCKVCHSNKQKEYRNRDIDAYNEKHRISSSKRRQENPDKINEYHRNWSEQNREHVNKKSREWQLNNPGKFKEGQRKSRLKNRDKKSAYVKEWTAVNKEKRKIQIKEWTLNNVEKVRAKWHRYISKKRGLPDDFTDDDYKFALDYWDGKCAITGEQCKLHLDHWIPLNSEHCPGTIPSNLLPIKDILNTSKQDKESYQWLIDTFGVEFANGKMQEINDYFNLVRL